MFSKIVCICIVKLIMYPYFLQVFVPFCSEMYASTGDPPEHRESPICTIKNFPYASEHTLQWVVELFENLFKQRPDDVNAYLSNRDFQESLKMSTTTTRHQILEMLRDALVKYKPLRYDVLHAYTDIVY